MMEERGATAGRRSAPRAGRKWLNPPGKRFATGPRVAVRDNGGGLWCPRGVYQRPPWMFFGVQFVEQADRVLVRRGRRDRSAGRSWSAASRRDHPRRREGKLEQGAKLATKAGLRKDEWRVRPLACAANSLPPPARRVRKFQANS